MEERKGRWEGRVLEAPDLGLIPAAPPLTHSKQNNKEPTPLQKPQIPLWRWTSCTSGGTCFNLACSGHSGMGFLLSSLRMTLGESLGSFHKLLSFSVWRQDSPEQENRSKWTSKSEATGTQSQGMENCSRSLQRCSSIYVCVLTVGRANALRAFLRRTWQRHSTVTGGITAHLFWEQLASQPSPFQLRNWSRDNIATITNKFMTQ